jgi:hypothetical protein
MVATLCDQHQSTLVNALIVAFLGVAIILVIIMVSRGCGLPGGASGGSFRGEKMVGAHWVQAGTYGHTGDTLPTYGDSGYYEMVPTPPWA